METNGTLTTIPTTDSCRDLYQCRSLYQIIWSCISVLVACTWVSVHPNIPAPDEGSWRIQGRKIGLMIVALIAPELLVLWAARQWFSARELAKQYRGKGWSVSHGFFVLMGGFARYRGTHLEEVLRYYNLNPREEKFISGILEREIKDRSHRDGFAKLIALWQTTWFVVQLLARWARHLPITELEIMTVAFATMNVLIYFFWWDKPLGVGCHIRIQDHFESVGVEAAENGDIPDHNLQSSTEETALLHGQAAQISPKQWVYSFCAWIWKPIRSYVDQVWQDSNRAEAIFWFLFTPVVGLASIAVDRNGLFNEYSTHKIPSFERTPDLEPSKQQDQFVAYGAAILFGAIHCAGWAFAFSSTVEHVLWRIASVIVTGAPLILLFGVYLTPAVKSLPYRWKKCLENLAVYFGIVFTTVYVLARVALIVLSFLTLRDLPSGAFETVKWTSFIPHI
ncbi:hypothetical protein GYMLUDRAFT_48747 [Collybiopsis luxurians FD-317 M1]|uniref:Uncharacterized protein n=1 Tax=Collybiopsis luxurians FD-317 M1 TaxID=944289 RepID=A0A0D0BHX3_9AGAR|nr:hypothetical protein GYMLUDRAFT_48747 [Collybiopsis luxurians FD-317 M1]